VRLNDSCPRAENAQRYAPFFKWLLDQLDANASPDNGYFGCQQSTAAAGVRSTRQNYEG
jgi:hypothetical protein